MAQSTKILLRIVTEGALENNLIEDVERLGAYGYTIVEARGKGSDGSRDGRWDFSGNIRMEVICDEAVAKAIASYLEQKYYDNYAMIVYWNEVSILREDKF